MHSPVLGLVPTAWRRRMSPRDIPDPWHVDDADARLIRDSNGLEVCRCLGPETAAAMVRDRDDHIRLARSLARQVD